MSKEAMKLALEALEAGEYYIDDLEAIVYAADDLGTHEDRAKMQEAITAIKQALANEALDKKAENARELGLDYEPAPVQEPVCDKDPQGCWSVRCQLGNKCKNTTPPAAQREPAPGYCKHCKQYTIEEPLPAAQRQWVGLTDEEVYPLANEHLHYQMEGYEVSGIYNLARAIEAKLKEKNA